MPVELSTGRYFTASEIVDGLGMTRQTLWRWRRSGKVPSGHRFRDGQVLFNAIELEAISGFANRIEPSRHDFRQLRLLTRPSG